MLFLLKCLVEFTNKIIWTGCFLFWKLINYLLISLIDVGLFRLSVPPYMPWLLVQRLMGCLRL